jgi:hypothetical protein
VLAGQPHWFFHHLGLGETLGYSTRLTMNNTTLYQNQENDFTNAIYIALMGDPALRMEPIAPAGNLTAAAAPGGVSLSWSASAAPVEGYHVYRAGTPAGPFTRLTTSLVTGTSFTDSTAPPGTYTYMVRAVALQTNPSGSYFNPSTGVFATVTAAGGSIRVQATPSGNDLVLQWNSVSGNVYHVQSKNTLTQASWSDASGSVMATGTATTWTLSNFRTDPQRYFRISSP